MLKRKIYDDLQDWKNKRKQVSLLLLLVMAFVAVAPKRLSPEDSGHL